MGCNQLSTAAECWQLVGGPLLPHTSWATARHLQCVCACQPGAVSRAAVSVDRLGVCVLRPRATQTASGTPSSGSPPALLLVQLVTYARVGMLLDLKGWGAHQTWVDRAAHPNRS